MSRQNGKRGNSVLKMVQQMMLDNELGPLAAHLLVICSKYSESRCGGNGVGNRRKKLQDGLLRDMRRDIISVEFGVYSSPSEQLGEPTNMSCFVAYTTLRRSGVRISPRVFHYRGDSTDLAEHMRRDAEILSGMGFRFGYCGHKLVRDSVH